MNENMIDTIRSCARTAFVAAVTAAMLALTLVHAQRGGAGIANVVAYALTAGFGLEFVGSAWRHGWRRRAGRAPGRVRQP